MNDKKSKSESLSLPLWGHVLYDEVELLGKE